MGCVFYLMKVQMKSVVRYTFIDAGRMKGDGTVLCNYIFYRRMVKGFVPYQLLLM